MASPAYISAQIYKDKKEKEKEQQEASGEEYW